jgi:signal transduction histidine kinase
MRSIQARLSTGLLFSLIVAFSAFWLLVSINIQFLAEEYIASRMAHDADTLLSAIEFDNIGNLTLDDLRIDLVYNQPFSGHYFVINTDVQTVSSRSLWDHPLKHIDVNTDGQPRTKQPGPEEQSLLVISRSYTKQGNQLMVSIAEDLNPINKNIIQFQYWLAALALGMLLLLVIFQAIILRRSLRPITSIHTELKSLEQGKLEKLSTDSPAELRPLINEVNHLLAVMEHRLRRSRDALSDLAHAIKKPLTVIQQQTNNNDSAEAANSTILKQTDEIYQLSDRILKRARLAGHSHSGALFSFSEDLPALITTLEVMHPNKTVRLMTDIPAEINCPIDRQDMLELLGNILDNAYKWAQQNIKLSVSNIDLNFHICIEDDGPGADPDKINELSQRGVRLDEQIEGHGFGLAIAADMVNDYGGNISFQRSDELGGFRVDINLKCGSS